MKTFEIQLGVCQKTVNIIANAIDNGTSYEAIDYRSLYEELSKLKDLMPESLLIFRSRLEKVIIPNIKLHDLVQKNHFGQNMVVQRNGINPYVFGQTIATLHYISDCVESQLSNTFWYGIHPLITSAARQLFENTHYAESVEAAFLEISVRVKGIIKSQTGEDLDETTAMQKAFSVNNPIIKVADISSRTGKDIQQGVMELFCGSTRYIRNPKAHEKVVMGNQEAISKLHLASLLMYEIDKADLL